MSRDRACLSCWGIRLKETTHEVTETMKCHHKISPKNRQCRVSTHRTGSAGYPPTEVKLTIFHCCLCSLQMRHKHGFLWVWHSVSKAPLEVRTCKRRKMIMHSNMWFLCKIANWQETIFATPRWVIPEQRQLLKRSFYTREFLLVTSTDQQGRNELSTQASSTAASHLQKQSYLSMENVILIAFEAGMVAQHFRGQVRGPLQVQD